MGIKMLKHELKKKTGVLNNYIIASKSGKTISPDQYTNTGGDLNTEVKSDEFENEIEEDNESLSGFLSDDNDEDDVESLEAMAALKHREHQIKMKQFSKVNKSLASDIAAQELLLSKLSSAKKAADSERKAYENKLQSAEKEIKAVRAEREKMMKTTNKNDANFQKMVAKYESKLDKLQKKLDEYKGKLKETEQLKKLHQKEERRIIKS